MPNRNQADGLLMAPEGGLHEERKRRRSWNLVDFYKFYPLFLRAQW